MGTALPVSQQALAIDESNVLVLFNLDDGDEGDGKRIADYYKGIHPDVHVHGIPGVNAVLTGLTNEEISAQNYLDVIRGSPNIPESVLHWFSENPNAVIDVIVTTKGLPLLINAGGAAAQNQTWPYSSLESELTRIDSIDTPAKMRDQFIWTAAGYHQYDPTLPNNPYYDTNAAFDRAGPDGGIRLSARLDGFTVDAVKDSIDRAQQVYVMPQGIGPYVVVDDDPTAGTDQMVNNTGPGPGLVAVLNAHNRPMEYENTTDAITDLIDPSSGLQKGSVIGYVSHGLHGSGLEKGYIQNQLDFDLANGAVFLTHESYNARSFDPGFSQDQGLIAQWIDQGGTAGLGHVQEPLNGPDNVTNEDLLFDMLLPDAGETGLTFVEAAWNATRQLSYVNTVVGDPLMVFRGLILGDANKDGVVDVSDLGMVAGNYGASGQMWEQGDFNGDGFIDISDLGAIATHWGETADWYVGSPARAVPEPSALILALAGIVTLFGWRRRG